MIVMLFLYYPSMVGTYPYQGLFFFHVLALGNLRATLYCAGVYSQSCPQAARVGLL